jgi:hypothetical protein
MLSAHHTLLAGLRDHSVFFSIVCNQGFATLFGAPGERAECDTTSQDPAFALTWLQWHGGGGMVMSAGQHSRNFREFFSKNGEATL